MKPSYSLVLVFLVLSSTLISYKSISANEPSDKDIEQMLKPSWDKNSKWKYTEFERTTEIPAITIQNLPASQIGFRIGALKAVSKSIQSGAFLAYQSYEEKNDLRLYKRIEIPREQTLFGKAVSVIILIIDDNEKTVSIAVRGTVSIDDVLQDLNATAVFDDELGFRIHSGFRILSREILAHLKQHYLNEEHLKNYKFNLSGHSLGGSIASILSMYLHQAGSQVASVVTLGAPRFTTNEGARKFQILNQVTHRIVRCDDVVPFLPPPNFFGWSNESYQANGNIFLLLDPPYFDYSIGIDIERDFTYQLRLELHNKGVTQRLAYGHRMDNYYSLLTAFIPFGMMYLATLNESVDRYESVPDLKPISYTLNLQSKLCPGK